MFRQFLIIVFFALILVSGKGYCEKPEQNSGKTTPIKQESAADDPVSIVIVTDPAQAKARESREKESSDVQKRDLVAQERMAEATEAMNRATQSMMYAAWVSVFVGMGGLLALVYTFLEQRKMFRADAQAYVEVIWLDVRVDPTYGLTLLIYLANRGKTPAKALHFSGNLFVKQVNGVKGKPRKSENDVFAELDILPANSNAVMAGRNWNVLEDFRFMTDYTEAGSHGRKTWLHITESDEVEIDSVTLRGKIRWVNSFNIIQEMRISDKAELSSGGRPLWLGNQKRRGKPKHEN